MMKLYYYEHCPFCIRVLMFISYKKLDIALIVLPNDDESTPISMIGKKMLPILEKDDGSYLPESLDIIDYLDHLSQPILTNTPALSPEANSIFDEMMPIYRALVFPRMPDPLFLEFETRSARDYFKHKKEKSTGSFDACFAKTDELIAAIKPKLIALSENIACNEEKLTRADIEIYPWLYLLKLVNTLILPDKIQKYLDTKTQQIHASKNTFALGSVNISLD